MDNEKDLLRTHAIFTNNLDVQDINNRFPSFNNTLLVYC